MQQKIKLFFFLWVSFQPVVFAQENKPPSSPDVLFIVIDDLNDWISLLDPESPIKTPQMERLAKRGMLFTKAYCISAACNPSRTATLTGLRPSTSGVYGNNSDWRFALPKHPTIMQKFRTAGYRAQGAGKIFHHKPRGAFHDKESFEDFLPMKKQLYPPKKLNGAPEYGSRNTDWGIWPKKEEDTVDHPTVEYCIKALKETPTDKPLFLACGIYKPHSPFFAPQEFHRAYKEIPLPPRKIDDEKDLPPGAISLMKNKKWFWKGMMAVEKKKPGSYHDFIRSYAACIAYTDYLVGKLLDALDQSPRKDNTIIVLWSDHGFHIGEKDHIEKFALWEKSNHVPLIISAPGITPSGSRCDQPMDLTVLYPTLLELCGLPAQKSVDGKSIVKLLKNPNAPWELPALMTYGRGNHAVRTDRWRYIRYKDGTEELYDHSKDPHEWNNLAGEAQYREVILRHRKWLPKEEVKRVRDLRR